MIFRCAPFLLAPFLGGMVGLGLAQEEELELVPSRLESQFMERAKSPKNKG